MIDFVSLRHTAFTVDCHLQMPRRIASTPSIPTERQIKDTFEDTGIKFDQAPQGGTELLWTSSDK